MQIKLLGTRGSIPAPGDHTVKYGGNTTCIEYISDKGIRIIIDAGTGIRKFNSGFLHDPQKTIKIVFTHCHWDHLQGLPFFSQLFVNKNKIMFYINKKHFNDVKKSIIKQMKGNSFPVDFDKLPATIQFIPIDKKIKINKDLELQVFENSHPGGASGLKFIEKDKVFTFITDNEIKLLKEAKKYNELLDFSKDSDILIHDGQYIEKDMKIKKGWGHSTIDDIVELFINIKPKIGIFTHHDPDRSDKEVEELEKWAKSELKKHKVNTRLKAAVEDEVITM